MINAVTARVRRADDRRQNITVVDSLLNVTCTVSGGDSVAAQQPTSALLLSNGSIDVLRSHVVASGHMIKYMSCAQDSNLTADSRCWFYDSVSSSFVGGGPHAMSFAVNGVSVVAKRSDLLRR